MSKLVEHRTLTERVRELERVQAEHGRRIAALEGVVYKTNAPQEGAHCADTPKDNSILGDIIKMKAILDNPDHIV